MSSINPLDRQRAKDFQRFAATESLCARQHLLEALNSERGSLDWKYAAIQANHAAEYSAKYARKARAKMGLED